MTPDTLLAGPRGRRVLLDFLLLSEDVAYAGERKRPLRSAVLGAAHHLGEQAGVAYTSLSALRDKGYDVPQIPSGAYSNDYPRVMPPDVVARLIRDTPPAEPAPERLVAALDMSVAHAMYWQPPDGEDVLASHPVVVEALQDAAAAIAASPHTSWWDAPLGPDSLADQWTVSWSDEPGEPATGISECPEQSPGKGEWWSFPSGGVSNTDTKLLSSTRRISDGDRDIPAGMLAEGVFRGGAWVRALHVPDALIVQDSKDIYELTGPEDWANLCRRFPLDVTDAVQRGWSATTGLDSPEQRWVMPDWAAVSRNYDGVHLSISGYLATATQAVHLDDRTASVLAGWGPDATYWFAPVEEAATATWWELKDGRWGIAAF